MAFTPKACQLTPQLKDLDDGGRTRMEGSRPNNVDKLLGPDLTEEGKILGLRPQGLKNH